MERIKQVISWVLGAIAVLAIFGALWSFWWLGCVLGFQM